MSRSWSPQEEAKLKKLFGKRWTDPDISVHLPGRTPKAIKSRRKVLGLTDKNLHISQQQKETIVRYYPTRTAHEVGKMIGREVWTVYAFAKANKLQKVIRWPQAVLERVELLNKQGLGEAETARESGLTRNQVHHIWTRLKLKSSEEAKQRGYRRAIESQRRSLGIKTAGQLRALSFRRYAERHGLPADLKPRSVRIVYALAVNGMMTRKQLAAAIGMPWKGTRKSLCSMDPEGSYLANLQARGIVVQLKRKLQVGGQGQNVSLYDLTLQWRERITAHATKLDACAS